MSAILTPRQLKAVRAALAHARGLELQARHREPSDFAVVWKALVETIGECERADQHATGAPHGPRTSWAPYRAEHDPEPDDSLEATVLDDPGTAIQVMLGCVKQPLHRLVISVMAQAEARLQPWEEAIVTISPRLLRSRAMDIKEIAVDQIVLALGNILADVRKKAGGSPTNQRTERKSGSSIPTPTPNRANAGSGPVLSLKEFGRVPRRKDEAA